MTAKVVPIERDAKRRIPISGSIEMLAPIEGGNRIDFDLASRAQSYAWLESSRCKKKPLPG